MMTINKQIQLFPRIDEKSFINTRVQFHSVAKVIGKLREALVAPVSKNDNLFLNVVEQGFCTPPIRGYNELEIGCSPEKNLLEIADASGKYFSVSINAKTQLSLYDEVVKILEDEFRINIQSDPANFDSGSIYELDENLSKDFNIQLVNFNTLLREFRKRINTGVKSEICLWPHHFDNAFKWFSGKKIDGQDEQMGIGISNGDEIYELPYIYITFWPAIRKTNALEIPNEAVLHDKQWTGLVLTYESVARELTIESQKSLIDNFFDASFTTITKAFSKR